MDLATSQDTRGAAVWIAAVPAVSLIASLALACAMPFTALAAIAAMRMRTRDGLTTLVIAWAGNQLIGFAMLGYPHDWRTLTWGPALLSATLVAFVAAGAAYRRVDAGGLARGALGSLAAFVAFKLTLIGWSLLLGGLGTATSPYWTARQLLIDGGFIVALLALYRAGVAAGLPSGRAVTA